MKAGDILGIQGADWLSDAIRNCTGIDGKPAVLSHVGIVTATEPFVQITEALTRVETRPLDVSINAALHAWIIEVPVDGEARTLVARKALSFTGEEYGYSDIVLQGIDALVRSRWVAEHLAERKFPICSMLDAVAEGAGGLFLGIEGRRLTPQQVENTITPADIWTWAVKHGWPRTALK